MYSKNPPKNLLCAGGPLGHIAQAADVEKMVPATIDQNLVANAVVEFHTAKDHGKSDPEAWAATIARIRFDTLRLAITTLAAGGATAGGIEDEARKQCIHELLELQGSYEGDPDKPL